MSYNPLAQKLRSRKLGVLIYDARKSARRSAEECAHALNITRETYLAYEEGSQSPSLPELELLAILFGVPLDHFWKNQTAADAQDVHPESDAAEKLVLRHAAVAEIIQETRIKLGTSVEAMAEKTGIDPSLYQSYENGETPIALPVLETISKELSLDIEQFLDKDTSTGEIQEQETSIDVFNSLPGELQEFIGKPINLPYLELAKRLSGLSVERLRAIAEGILEITY